MPRNKIVTAIFDNWPAKMLSLAAALVLSWLWHVNRLGERQIAVPLRVTTNAEYAAASKYPRTVRLVIRGEPSAIGSLLESDFEASIDLSKAAEEGELRVPVEVRKLGIAVGMDPLQVTPDIVELTVSMERRTQAVVPIVPVFRDVLEAGYELSYVIEPDRVAVSGPASLVANLRAVTTDFIDLAGRSSDFAAEVRLVGLDQLLELSGPARVRFSATIRKTMSSRSFDAVPVRVDGLPQGFALSEDPQAVTVVLLGPRETLDAFVPGADFAVIDLSDVRASGGATVPVVVNAPPGTTLESCAPAALTVQIVHGRQAGERP